MKTVHFRISQISIPPLENNDISYSLSVHIGQTFVEYPLQIEEKNFLKSPVIVSFNYDSASDYEFHIELLEKRKYSDQTELASIDIPIRICRANRQVINGCLDMEIKDESFLNTMTTDANENLDSDDEYDLEEDTKSIKIFFDIHRSENEKKRFTAHLTQMRDLNTAFLTTSRQSFESSCSFTESFNKKRSASNKSALSPPKNEDEDNKENEAEITNEQRQNKQTKEELEEEQQITDEKDQTINQDDPNDEENNQDSSQIQQIEDQNEQESLEKKSHVIEEEEEELENYEKDDENNEKEKSESDNNDEKIDNKGKSSSLNQSEELMDEDGRPSRKRFLSESDSDDNEIGEDNENNDDNIKNDSHPINIVGDDDESIPPVESNASSNQENGSDEDEEKQTSIHRSLSSDSARFKVYPPPNKVEGAQINKESELSEPEANEQPEKENQQLSENPEETEPNEQQEEPEPEISEYQEEPKSIGQPEVIEQQEDPISIEQEEESQQQKEQIQQAEIVTPPFSVPQQQQAFFYPQSNESQVDEEPPVQQQPPMLRFSSLDMQNFECLDNYSFYPTPEQIGSYYIPPSLLPISIHPPYSD